MRIKLTMFFLIAAILSACSGADEAPTLEVLLDRHTQARGGAAAIQAVQRVVVELEITEPTFRVTGRYVATREGLMRIDIFADEQRVFSEALGPGGGWQMGGDGTVKDLSQEGEKALMRGIIGNLYGLHERQALGYRLELVGKTERHGHAVYEIRETAPDGFSKHLFIDAETYLITGDVRTSALHPDVDSTEQRQETRYMDHTPTAGVLFGMREEKRDLDTGALMQSTRVSVRAVNPVIDPDRFDRPEQKAAVQ